MVIGNLLGGLLFDKLGGYKMILIGIFICFCSIMLFNFFYGWFWYVVWFVMLGFGGGMIIFVIYVMVGVVWLNGGR